MLKVRRGLEWNDLMCELNFMELDIKISIIFWVVTYDIKCREWQSIV